MYTNSRGWILVFIKKYISLRLTSIKILFKGMRYTKNIPLIFMYIIIPIINLSAKNNIQTLQENIIMTVTLIYPILPIILQITILKEFVEGQGNELLYISKRVKIFEMSSIFIRYIIYMIIPFLIYTKIIGENTYVLFIKTLILVFFYMGLTYFLVYITKSIVIVFIPVIFLTLNNISTFSNIFNSFVYYDIMLTKETMIKDNLIFIILGSVFWIVGYIFNKKLCKYV